MRRLSYISFLAIVLTALSSWLVPPALAATVTSGQIRETPSGAPATVGWAGLVRRSTLDSYPPGTQVWPEQLAELDGQGNYSFAIDDADPSYDQFYLFTLSIFHFDQIYDGVASSWTLPLKEEFFQGGIVPLDGRQSNPGVDFALQSNKHTEMVLMRDGVTHLATDVYLARPQPPGCCLGQAPTVLTRTVYGKDNSAWNAVFTVYGYNAVVQDSRGRFDSEGTDPVFRDDAWGPNQDGYDTVEWVAAQPFSDGKVGMYGGSALGITQYLTAGAAPPHLTCCYAVVGTGNLYDGCIYTGGIFRKHMIETWLEGQGSLDHLPELEAHPNRDDYWDAVDVVTRLDQIDVPFFHAGGWFDIFQEGTRRGFDDFEHLAGPHARGTQKMLIGPWTHGGLFGQVQGELVFPANAMWDDGFSSNLGFFEYWLKGIDNGFYDTPPVRYYVMGDVDDPQAPGNEWRDANDWPPPAREIPYFLHADGTLSAQPARAGASGPASRAALSYTYDPADPVPTVGGANLSLPAGPYDQRVIEQRDDVLTFTTPPLDRPLEVTGRLRALLYVASSAPDTDFMVKLCDVYPDGRSMLIQEGAIRARHWIDDRSENLLEREKVYPMSIDLWSTSIIFNAGHRIRVSVTSSNDPRWDPNPNTGEPFRRHTHLDVATNTIYCSGKVASRIILPVAN